MNINAVEMQGKENISLKTAMQNGEILSNAAMILLAIGAIITALALKRISNSRGLCIMNIAQAQPMHAKHQRQQKKRL